MLESALRPGVVAIVGGIVLSMALLLPFAAVEYRRFGRLTWRSAAAGLGGAVYACALVTYTLLPLPERTADFCTRFDVPAQLVPFRFVADAAQLGLGSPAAVIGNAALQQVLLNVVLFLPLGVLLARATGWSVLAVAASGLAVSLLIEATQLTGIWTLFPCAYRVADVDDLIANTAGAVVGALAAPLLGRRRPALAPPSALPRTVTLGRRLTGMLCDVLVIAVVGTAASLTWTVPLALADRPVSGPGFDLLRLATGTLLPAALQLAVLLVSGQTIGEQAVRVQPVERPGRGRLLLRWLFGVGGWALLAGSGSAGFTATLLALAALVAVVATRDRRGLPYLVAGLQVQPSPAPAAAVEREHRRG